jgi:hypothetical protein
MKNTLKEIEEIQSYLEITCSDNPEEITQRIRELSAYLARTAFLLRDAKYALRRKKASEIGEIVVRIAKEQYLSAKAQNALVDSIAAEEHRLVDWLDRLNATCTHQIDALRSLLSYEKEQLRLRDTGY